MTAYTSWKAACPTPVLRSLALCALLLLFWPASFAWCGDEFRPAAPPGTVAPDPAGRGSGNVPGEIYVLPPAQDQIAVFARAEVRDRIDRLWRSRKSLVLESGEADSGPQSVAPIMEILHRQGYDTVAGMETNLVCESHLLMRHSQLERARQSLQAALELDPGYIPALSAQAEICVRRNPALVPGYLLAALGALGRSFWPALTALTDLALVLLFTLLVLSWLLNLVLVSRYQKAFRHSIEENWRERIPRGLVVPFGWILLLSPLFLFFGPFWTFAYWTALLWRFARRVERLMAVLSLVILALLIPAVDTVVGTFRDLDTGDLHLFSAALGHQLLSPQGETQIREQASAASPSEAVNFTRERQFLVASMQRKMGRDDDAFDGYTSIPVYHYLYPMAQNNIGNIYFSMNQFDLAIQHYRKALDVRPDYAECYFNLSNAQFQVYDFDHSDQSLGHAQRLAPLAIGKLINEETRGIKTLDHQIPQSFLWQLAWTALRHNAHRHFSRLDLDAAGTGRGLAGCANLLLLAAALLAALAGVLSSWINRHEEIRLCRSCGRAYCRICGPDPLKEEFCQQCTHLGSRKSGVSPEIRRNKLRQIGRHRLWGRIREGLLAVTMPGVESLRCGRTLPGAAVTAVWIFLVAVLIALPRFLPQIGLRTAPWVLNPLILVVGGLAALLWGASLLSWLFRCLRQGGWRSMDTVRPGEERS